MAGRPSTYDPAAEAAIFARIEAGEYLNAICRSDKKFPLSQTVRSWIVDDQPPGIAARYARSRNLGLDSRAEEIEEIASNQSLDPNSRRVMVDARKWILSKMRPDKYGDLTKLEHSGPGGAELKITVTRADK